LCTTYGQTIATQIQTAFVQDLRANGIYYHQRGRKNPPFLRYDQIRHRVDLQAHKEEKNKEATKRINGMLLIIIYECSTLLSDLIDMFNLLVRLV